MAATLARLSAPASAFETMISRAGLRGGPDADPFYDEMLIHVTESAVETPAGNTGGSVTAYCTIEADRFDELSVRGDDPVVAVFNIAEVLRWLDWLDVGERVELRVVGDPANGTASHLLAASAGVEVRIDCFRGPQILEQVSMDLPERFDADERFQYEDGTAPDTVVETTAAALSRIADAVALDPNVERYPLVVADGELRIEIGAGGATRVSGVLPADRVTGPSVENFYGDGFARVAEVLSGGVELQTGEDRPLVVVEEGTDYTLRFVLTPVVW